MNDDRQGEAAQMERAERCPIEMEGLSRSCRREQVDRIPNASLLEISVKASECGHSHAAREASSNSCRDRIRLEREPWPWEMGCDRQSFDLAPESRDGGQFFQNFDRLLLFLGEDFAKPPGAPSNEEDRLENTERNARKQSGKKQSAAECKHDGPGSRRRQIDRARRRFRCFRS